MVGEKKSYCLEEKKLDAGSRVLEGKKKSYCLEEKKLDAGSRVLEGKKKSYCLEEKKLDAGSSDKADKLNKSYKNGRIAVAMSVKE